MNQLRRLIIALAAICVLALAAFALVNRPTVPAPSDDEIIIKGGSLEVDCGKNHGKDCFGDSSPGKVKPKHKDTNKHITNIVIRDVGNNNQLFFDRSFDQNKPPQIEITYKAQIGVISK